jgi:3',5'-cyclic AMP phosphodiesterase CpdA
MLKIAHLSDLHVGETGFRKGKLTECVEELNDLNPDLVVVTGDLTDQGLTDQMLEAKSYLDLINADKLITMGNHDAKNVGYLKFERIIGPRWFKRESERCFILGVDSSEPDLDEGEIGKEGRRRMQEELSNAKEPFKIFVLHHHLLPVPLSGRERNVLVDAGDVLRILVKNNVILSLSGHKHVPYIWELGNMIVLHAGSASSSRLRGLDENVYNIVEVKENEISIFLKIIGGRTYDVAKFGLSSERGKIRLVERRAGDLLSMLGV